MYEQAAEANGRRVGGTEHSWCRAVPSGTGITVVALLLSNPPDFSLLRNALHKLQTTHPILRSKLHFNATKNSFSFIVPNTPHLQLQPFDLSSTADILRTLADPNDAFSVSPFHLIVEHELNQNSWRNLDESDVFFASVYTLDSNKWAVMLRLHTSACDRVAAAAILSELLLAGVGEREPDNNEIGLGMEEYIPREKANKPFWARGVDMLGYSLNAFRLSRLDFIDADSTRASQAIRFQINPDDTNRILCGCKSRGIGLCGALSAAALIAARSSKHVPDDEWEKYAVVTLINCRPILDPVLRSHRMGFYHSAILNTHDMQGGGKLWDLAKRTYGAFAISKKNNKHLSDMEDLNFLMCRALDNPGLTPSSSLRTSFISVFEEPVIYEEDDSREMPMQQQQQKIINGLEDYISCGSVHGIGPSIAIFDTIRRGKLDLVFVYPSPLHSREQMHKLVFEMKRILVDATSCLDQ